MHRGGISFKRPPLRATLGALASRTGVPDEMNKLHVAADMVPEASASRPQTELQPD